MNTYALGSAANEGAWRPAAASGLAVSASSAAARSTGGQNAVRNIRHSDVYCFVQCSRSGPMPNHCEDEGFGLAAENSVGPRPASRVLVSSVLFQMT
jgi:hypothetical protein